jgi:YVTN family beta-propeller protein
MRNPWYLAVAVSLASLPLPPSAADLIPSQTLDVTIPVGDGPTGAGFGEQFAWVTNGLDASVSKIDPRDDAVVKTIRLHTGGFPVRVATTPGAVWISECGIDSVVRVNTTKGKIEAIIPVGACPFGIDVFGGHLFVANADDRVDRIDPSTNSVVATIPVRIEPTPDDFNFINLRVAFGSVWVSTAVSTVVRIDPIRNVVVETIPFGPCCGHLGEMVASDKALWVSGDQFKNSLFRINPHSNRVVAEIPSPVAGLLHGNGFLGGFVWVISNNEGACQLMRADPLNNTMRATSLALGPDSFAMATGDGSLWVPSFSEGAVHRITPGAADLEHDPGD